MPRERLTYNGALVLQALARGYRYGFEIMDFTGLPSGTAYPILRRFEVEKLARSRWEGEKPAQRDGRPRRRYYELTDEGRKLLSAALERFTEHRRVFGDPAPEPESSR
ncbi:MAG TPA: PadR family transcriptional regulator [Vicinamibacteria bacterium]|jgi:DNA-binding PadR family transcriptional regulator